MEIKVTGGFVAFSNVVDRFLPSGYREGLPFEEQFARSTGIEGLDAIGLDYPTQFEDPLKVQALLDQHGLALSVIEIGICDILSPLKRGASGDRGNPLVSQSIAER